MGQERQAEFTQLIEVQRNRNTIRLCAFTVPTHAGCVVQRQGFWSKVMVKYQPGSPSPSAQSTWLATTCSTAPAMRSRTLRPSQGVLLQRGCCETVSVPQNSATNCALPAISK